MPRRKRQELRIHSSIAAPRVRTHTAILPVSRLRGDRTLGWTTDEPMTPTEAALTDIQRLVTGGRVKHDQLPRLLAHPDEQVILAALERIGAWIPAHHLVEVLLRRLRLGTRHDGALWTPVHAAAARLARFGDFPVHFIRTVSTFDLALDRIYGDMVPGLNAQETQWVAEMTNHDSEATYLIPETPHPEALLTVPEFAPLLRKHWRRLTYNRVFSASPERFKALLPALACRLAEPLGTDRAADHLAQENLAELEVLLRGSWARENAAPAGVDALLDGGTNDLLARRIVESKALLRGGDERTIVLLLAILERFLAVHACPSLSIPVDFFAAVQGSSSPSIRERGMALAQYC